MIDNYDEAMDLMRKMERELPIPAIATKQMDRVQKLARRNNHHGPTSFTLKPRRKDA